MKISWALLVLLLAAAWAGGQGKSLRASYTDCCGKKLYGKETFPVSQIEAYWYTSSSCTHRAVHVKLPKIIVCVDPEVKWFKEYLKKQKNPNSTTK